MTVTIGGKQRRRHCLDREDAEAQQQQWEMERIHGAAASRPKITALTVTELREAEAAMQILKGSGLSLLDCVRQSLRHPSTPAKDPKTATITFKQALEDFKKAKATHISSSQASNYHYRGTSFSTFIGEKKLLSDITSEDVIAWMEAKEVDGQPIVKKTWNNLRGDLAAIFSWCVSSPRRWISQNPADDVPKFSKRALGSAGPERLSIATAKEFMAAVEAEQPDWATYFAVCLFGGVRPDLRDGEMTELSRCVGRDGWDRYCSGGVLHLTAEITKTVDARSTTMPENLRQWLKAYPPTEASLRPGEPKDVAALRRRFSIPPDGLRHTAISAHVARHKSFADAAVEFGASEKIIRRHYYSRMSADEAEQFYSIFPERRINETAK